MDDGSKFILNEITNIVYGILNKENLLFNSWRFGKVAEVISTTKLKCYIDGSDVAITVSCNPDITFAINDEIWIVNTAKDNSSRFALCKRF